MTSNVLESYQERILKVLIYIQNHLDEDLTLNQLANIAHFSPYHFHRIFTAQKGESVQNYVRRLRLERASRDLYLTELPITRIAERAGYDTQQSFHRAFQRAYNTTPNNFRTLHRNKLLETQASKQQIPDTENKVVNIVNFPPTTVAFVRHVGQLDNAINSWMKLATEVGLTTIASEKTKKISIIYDSPEITPSERLRFDACITIDALPEIKAKGELGTQILHGGKYAVITHYGDINEIETTYLYLFANWLPNSGYEPADAPNFMLHRKLPFQTKASKLETDIYLPLK